MCGIACIFGNNPSPLEIKSMINAISHRGPDHKGFYGNSLVQLGSCRLSIFDLSDKANMPMQDKKKRYSIIYNGEIYNFKYLKKKYNLTTHSNSDTEVLIELFSKIGEKSFEEFNGIYAFIIYDSLKNKIYCVRDRLGIKPLYYYKKDTNYYFCSEIKGITSVINNVNINSEIVEFYLQNSIYNHSKETFFEKVNQVTQGSYMVFDLDKDQYLEKKYWNIVSEKTELDLDRLDEIFYNSLKLQQESDTKIGLNVSSGIDSNLMIGYLNKINKGQKNISANSYFYSDKQFDHREDLKEMSNFYGWKINTLEITPKDIIENFDEVAYYQDEPFPGVTTISKHLLIKKSYPSECKVILEGQGGDDIAAGYKYHFPIFLLDKITNFKIKDFFSEIFHFKKKENIDLLKFVGFFYNSIKGYYEGGISADGTVAQKNKFLNTDKKKIKKLYKENILNFCKNKSYLKKMLYRDIFFCKLPRILRTVDRASMAYGKEIRVPILDHNIVEFFFSLKSDDYIKEGNLRHKYRQLFLNHFPSNKFILNKKKYLPDPQTDWLKTELFDWMFDKLTSQHFDLNGMLNRVKLREYLINFKKNDKVNNSNLIWQLLNLEYLYRVHKK
ncbi:MAG: asparagine synthase (glutamine-hydrolyzing) [Pelagibacterales bacterium]|nr:asparagine synthase (glutamine-hydrolyzing) [Pelagibacterales bacterium]